MRTYKYFPALKANARTIRLTDKGWWALEMERRKRLYPNLDPEKDWIEIPASWLLKEGK